jgi:hypothetical protein
VKDPTALQLLHRAWSKATGEERKEFTDWLEKYCHGK